MFIKAKFKKSGGQKIFDKYYYEICAKFDENASFNSFTEYLLSTFNFLRN